MDDSLVGQSLALLSAMSFACSNIFISRTKSSRGDKGLIFSVLVTLVLSLLVWIVLESGKESPAVTGRNFWVGLCWFSAAGLSAMVFGRSLLFESVRRLGVSRSSAVKRLNPFFSVLFAALLLGEVISGHEAAGMALIAVAFGLLILDAFSKNGQAASGGLHVSNYMFGVLAAVAYACAYILRKLGLDVLPSASLGTFVSAVAGLASFMVLSLFSARYRGNFRGVFAYLDRWIVMAAIMVSAGQILLFAALAFEEVSTVVMIASLEIFIAMFLSVVIFRTEKLPSGGVLVSAVLATAGVLLVALG